MLDGPRERIRHLLARGRSGDLLARLRRLERRELREFRRWLEHTRNLIHLSVLVFVPLVIGVVTYLSNLLHAATFLLFPPLASGTYTLFADPEGRYSSPPKFVGGTTLGALSGWIALELSAHLWYATPPGRFQVHAGAAALGIFLTGLATWTLDLEEPTAFSAALLVLLFAGDGAFALPGLTVPAGAVYVVGVASSSTLVAAAFAVWRAEVYEQRAQFLYETTRSDDHVLVLMRGEHAETVATFGGRLAGAHEAGKVVLLEMVDDEAIATAERAYLARPDDARPTGEEAAVKESAARLERVAERIEDDEGVPCDVVVIAPGVDDAAAVRKTAAETGCDLVVAPYESADGSPTAFVRSLFRADVDVVTLRPVDERTRWREVLVPVRRAGDQAHAMLDFARRLAGQAGRISVCRCIDREGRRRAAEEMLAALVEPFGGRFETRVAHADVAAFLERTAGNYDLTVVGASTDRSATSRLLSRPTFERIQAIDCDLAVVHRAR